MKISGRRELLWIPQGLGAEIADERDQVVVVRLQGIHRRSLSMSFEHDSEGPMFLGNHFWCDIIDSFRWQ